MRTSAHNPTLTAPAVRHRFHSLFKFTLIVRRLHGAEVKYKLCNRYSGEVEGFIVHIKLTTAASFTSNIKLKSSSAPGLTHLDNVVVNALWVPVDQIDLLGVEILHRLLVQTVVVHVFVVRFVYVPLFSDERRMQKLLSGSGGGRERRESRGGGIVRSALRGRETGAASYQPAPQTGMGLNE